MLFACVVEDDAQDDRSLEEREVPAHPSPEHASAPERSTIAAEAEPTPCGERPYEPRRLSVLWDEVTTPVGRVSTTGTLRATIVNTGEVRADGYVLVDADAGTTRSVRKRVKELSLAPGERAVVDVDLRALELDLDRMDYAGAVFVTAVLPPMDASMPVTPVKLRSTDLYFHPEPDDTFVVYGEELFEREFSRGDFKGRHRGVDLGGGRIVASAGR